MQDFYALENIKRYKQILAETTDPNKRAIVRQFLADEEARLNDQGGPEPLRSRPERS